MEGKRRMAVELGVTTRFELARRMQQRFTRRKLAEHPCHIFLAPSFLVGLGGSFGCEIVAQLFDFGDRNRGHEAQEKKKAKAEKSDGAREQAPVDPCRSIAAQADGKKSRCSEMTT